jgi:hypothetical protein
LRDVNTICRRSWYIAAHIWKMYDFKIEVVPFIIILVLSWPLSSNSRYKSKNDANEAVPVVSLTSNSGGYQPQRFSGIVSQHRKIGGHWLVFSSGKLNCAGKCSTGASGSYSDFLKRHLHLRNRLLEQGYKTIRLIRSLKKFIFRYQDLVEIYSVSAETIIHDAFSHSEIGIKIRKSTNCCMMKFFKFLISTIFSILYAILLQKHIQ